MRLVFGRQERSSTKRQLKVLSHQQLYRQLTSFRLLRYQKLEGQDMEEFQMPKTTKKS